MQIKGKIVNSTYISSSTPSLVQGIKNNSRPKNAVAGGNGSWIVSNPPQVNINVLGEDHNYYRFNIYYPISQVSNRRMSKKYAQSVIEYLRDKELIIEDNYITNLETLLSNFVNNT